jgi:bacillithiol biosynthesis cysteine-adding enzyme BshC
LTTLQFDIDYMPFSEAPAFGLSDPFSRLFDGKKPPEGFPLWTSEDLGQTSEWLDRDSPASLDAIHRQNPDQPAPPPDARFAVAGQQAGLLTGPLYTFLKAVSLITFCRRIKSESKHPVLPLFWVASEDHDVLEVNRVRVEGKTFTHEYEGELKRGQIPQVADIDLRAAREPLLTFLEQTLPPTEFTDWVMEAVSSANYSNYASAFASLMRALFKDWDLRLVDPIPLRSLTSPVLAALVARWPEVTAAFERGSERLRKAGFDPPLDRPGLFEIIDGHRVAVDLTSEGAALSQGQPSLEEAAEAIRRRPGDFSPNAALRPVLQDAALPVAVTFAGPTELLYLWQIGPIYDVIGATPSRLFPRISATFVESKIQRAAEKLGLAGTTRLFDAWKELDSESYLEEGGDDERTAAIDRAGQVLLEEIDTLMREQNPNWLEKTRERLAGQIEKIVTRLREDRSQEVKLSKSRLERIAESILPDRKPQERAANPIEFLNLHGPDFIRLAIETLDPRTHQHQVVHISTESETD